MAPFDLFVIGGGSGGVACARRAASHGARVALCESGRLGGTCVIRGCVPKKLMHYGAHFSEWFKASKAYGWEPGQPPHDWNGLLTARNREIERLGGIYQNMLQKAGVTVIEGHGRVIEGNGDARLGVEVAGERYGATNVLVAVGGRPSLVDVPGIEHAITSDHMLEDLYDQPERLVVVGGGYIGVELASIFHALGTNTQIVLRGDAPLRGFDGDLRQTLADQIEKHGVTLRTGTQVTSIHRGQPGRMMVETDGGSIETDQILYATGRKALPNTEGVGLDVLGVRTNNVGSIYVDRAYQSNVPGLYAVGDCSDHAGNGITCGFFDLTPVAIAEGRVIAETLFNDNPHQVDYETIPTAIFSLPQAGTVGMSEERAREQGFEIDVYRTRFKPMMHTLTGEDHAIMMKLIVDRPTDRVLGCHMVGDEAAEIIQGLAVALTAGATKAHFDATVGVHPSAAEEFVTMYQAVS
ncbi:MAG: glutathione-disulfide reductase [Geminicoccaceae bacterium]